MVLSGAVGFVQRKNRQFQPVSCAGLTKYTLQVSLDGVLANGELMSDVSILHAARDRISDLPFAVGEPV